MNSDQKDSDKTICSNLNEEREFILWKYNKIHVLQLKLDNCAKSVYFDQRELLDIKDQQKDINNIIFTLKKLGYSPHQFTLEKKTTFVPVFKETQTGFINSDDDQNRDLNELRFFFIERCRELHANIVKDGQSKLEHWKEIETYQRQIKKLYKQIDELTADIEGNFVL